MPLDDRRWDALLGLPPERFLTLVEHVPAEEGLGMDFSSWRRVVGVLNDLAELSPAERSAYLAPLRASDAATYRRVKDLLTSASGSLSSEFPLIGKQLGPYKVQSVIGLGGMGVVYGANDSRFGRDVAIKILRSAGFPGPDKLRRFQQEAKAAGGMNHPHIVTVHDIGDHEGAPYLVTELLKGDPLRKLMLPGGLPESKAVEYALQVARGLAAAHDQGIIHRDIKPENLFVTRDPVTGNDLIKVLDFGLAKLTDQQSNPDDTSLHTRPGTIMGTSGYMSPEQLRGDTVDARTDVWSWGVVLYELVAGRRPFKAASRVDEQDAILNREPQPATTNRKLNNVIMKALSKRPAERYASMQEAVRDLEMIQKNLQQVDRHHPGSRSRKTAGRIAAASLLAFVALALILIWHGRTSAVDSEHPLTASNAETPARPDVTAPPLHHGSDRSLPADSAKTRPRRDSKVVLINDAEIMTVALGYYHKDWNAAGKGVPHRYEVKAFQDALLVADGATGLMWQRGGSSPRLMDFQDAETYVQSLNAQRLGGFDDWRLPTLEEAMSLMTPPESGQPGQVISGDAELTNGVYHISPDFEVRGAPFIWTADPSGPGRGWVVYFWDGVCATERLEFNSYVRAVRSMR
jgi:serine/threonine protein kinase